MFSTTTLTGEVIVTHFFNSGCPCCLPRQGVVAAPVSLHHGGRRGRGPRDRRKRDRLGHRCPGPGGPKPGRPILIKGGFVLSLDRAVGDFEQADVLIEGKKISAVRPNISAPNAQVIDAKNRIVMPGFVDTHRHMWQGFLRNVLPDGSLEDYRNVVQRTFGAKMVPDDVYAADLISALGAVDSGVTCVLDWSHIGNSPEHTDACIKGLQEFGRARRVRLWRRPERDRPGHGDSDRQISRRHRPAAQAVLLQRRPAHHALSRGARRPARGVARAVQGRARRRRPHQHPCRRRRVRQQRVHGEGQRARTGSRTTPPTSIAAR